MKKIILVFVSLICFGCSNNAIDPAVVTAPPAVAYPIVINPFLIGKNENIGATLGLPQQNRVITNQADWTIFLNSLIYPTCPRCFNVIGTFSTTTIDFANYNVIVCIDVVRQTVGGNEITIVGINENQNTINVSLTHVIGGFFLLISQPYHIVRIPKSTKPVVFQ